MAIQWDSVLVRGVAAALVDRLDQARARAFLMDHGARTLTVFFRTATLTLRLHPTRGDLALSDPREPSEGARALPARLREVEARFDDRVLRLGFRRVRGRPSRIDVVVELMTNQWNALVVERDSGIVRHALWSRGAGDRVLRTGAVYAQPRASERLGPTDLHLEQWREITHGEDRKEQRRQLLRAAAFTSSINAPTLLDSTPEEGYRRWVELTRQPLGRTCVLAGPRGLQPYPHTLATPESTPTADLFEAFARTSADLDRTVGAPGDGLDPALAAGLVTALKRARGRVVQLERQLEKAPKAEGLRGMGDLLLARLHEVPAGADTVTLPGFDGHPVDIELDPSMAPANNARRYYDLAGRAERAAARVPAMLDEARMAVSDLEALQARVAAGEATPDEVRPFVPAGGSADRSGTDGPTLPYRSYRSSGGLEIRVGRGSRFNDDLTFHHSAPNDVWLHARHAAGAHVVLRWSEDGNPPARDLEEAAVLAALHSKARTSGSVPVDWTRRKYVRKPRKAPRGVVTLDRVKTVFVEPDPALEARLGEGPGDGAAAPGP